jgi:thiamine-phosphate pyrophosphorylase
MRHDKVRIREALRLMAITPDVVWDDGGAAQRSLLNGVEEAIAGGITSLQYRDKRTLAWEDRLRLARTLQGLCASHDVWFVVNDNADLAFACGADAVHVGPEDESPASIVARLSGRLVVGGSAGTPERALHLLEQGVGYLGVGAIFDASATKPNASGPRGTQVLQHFRANAALSSLPLIAIGGITVERVGDCVRAGADGVAVVRAILGMESPRDAARTLLREVETCLVERSASG